jgi:diacylglycerol kinase (ATP)
MTPPRRTWYAKFRDAFQGLAFGIRGQSSFVVHTAAAIAVAIFAVALQVSLVEASLLALAVAGVMAAELFNTALERLADAVDTEHNPTIGEALDIASAAVLVAALGAATVGTIVFGYRLGIAAGWWE